MRKITCDRCGREIKGQKLIGYVVMGRRDVLDGKTVGDVKFRDWDFCDKCMEELDAVIENRKKPATEPEKKIDTGKVRALMDAGWTTEEIALDFHVPTDRIRQVIKEVRKNG